MERELARCGVCRGDHLDKGLQVGAFGASTHQSRKAPLYVCVCVRPGRLLQLLDGIQHCVGGCCVEVGTACRFASEVRPPILLRCPFFHGYSSNQLSVYSMVFVVGPSPLPAWLLERPATGTMQRSQVHNKQRAVDNLLCISGKPVANLPQDAEHAVAQTYPYLTSSFFLSVYSSKVPAKRSTHTRTIPCLELVPNYYDAWRMPWKSRKLRCIATEIAGAIVIGYRRGAQWGCSEIAAIAGVNCS